jgi:hypothetical protein
VRVCLLWFGGIGQIGAFPDSGLRSRQHLAAEVGAGGQGPKSANHLREVEGGLVDCALLPG